MNQCPRCGCGNVKKRASDLLVCANCNFLWEIGYIIEKRGVTAYWKGLSKEGTGMAGDWIDIPKGTLPIFNEKLE